MFHCLVVVMFCLGTVVHAKKPQRALLAATSSYGITTLGASYPIEGANFRVLLKPPASATMTQTMAQPRPFMASSSAIVDTTLQGSKLSQWVPYTQDIPLMRALQVLSQCPLPEAQQALQTIKHHGSKLVMKVLATLSPQYAMYDALSWIAPEGRPYLFIAERHRHAPPHALAALIAHEALHDDLANSIEEETEGWRREALVWHYFQSHPPALTSAQEALRHGWWQLSQQDQTSVDSLSLRPPKKQDTTKQWQYLAPYLPEEGALVKRLLVLEKAWQAGTLARLVAQNPGYQGLPRTFQDAQQVVPHHQLPAIPVTSEGSEEYAPPPFVTTEDK
jgi:hypothetical protein